MAFAIEHGAGNAILPAEIPLPETVWLGRQSYRSLWRQMQERAAAIAAGRDTECIWSCEHDPVYTTGRRGRDNRTVAELPAPLMRTDRGGETTFHGPGQVMLYPVLDLRRRRIGARRYVEMLEQSCMSMLKCLGVAAGRRCGFPGVWTDAGKIAALGIRIHNGIAYHGMALNVSVDPRWFACIEPCGLSLPVDRLDRYDIPLPDDARLATMWANHLIGLLP